MYKTQYIGVVGGLHTWNVFDSLGQLVGTNQRGVTPPEPTPATVSARQIRLWLLGKGVSMSAVDAAIDALPDAAEREAVRVEWEYAPYVERAHPMLVPLAVALGLTEEQVDQAFVEAAVL